MLPSHHATCSAAEVKESLHLLYDGVGGVQAAITEIRGDWKFQQEWLNLTHYYRANSLCHCCYAKVPDYGVVPSNLHRLDRRDADTFRAECLRPGPQSYLPVHHVYIIFADCSVNFRFQLIIIQFYMVDCSKV